MNYTKLQKSNDLKRKKDFVDLTKSFYISVKTVK
jgi:hypothetical protein